MEHPNRIPHTFYDYAAFVIELNSETPRGLATLGPAFLDEILRQTLESFFRDCKAARALLGSADAFGALSTFGARIDACTALGLISDFEYEELKQLAVVRNRFAHDLHGTTFDDPKIKKACEKLKSTLPESQRENPTSRDRFYASIRQMSNNLLGRHKHVRAERRAHKDWVDHTRFRVKSGAEIAEEYKGRPGRFVRVDKPR